VTLVETSARRPIGLPFPLVNEVPFSGTGVFAWWARLTAALFLSPLPAQRPAKAPFWAPHSLLVFSSFVGLSCFHGRGTAIPTTRPAPLSTGVSRTLFIAFSLRSPCYGQSTQQVPAVLPFEGPPPSGFPRSADANFLFAFFFSDCVSWEQVALGSRSLLLGP